MTEENNPVRRKRYLIDRLSQVPAALHVVAVLAGVGLLQVIAVVVLSHADVRGGRTLAESSGLLVAVHAGLILIGTLALVWTMLKMTHRYAGPAHVMKSALAAMRRGEYGRRLTLRRPDYLAELAQEIQALREEIAMRDVQHARTVNRLERALEEDDEPAVLENLRALGSSLPALPTKPGAPLERRTA